MAFTTYESPIGTLTIVGVDDAVTGLYMPDHSPAPKPETFGDRDDAALENVVRQLEQYFAGERTTFDVDVRVDDSGFQGEVWRALREIPFGETRSYADIAAAIGRPKAVRAVGAANSRNPVSIIVPCHRVIASTGKLTGYAGGIDRKRTLLELEGALEKQPA